MSGEKHPLLSGVLAAFKSFRLNWSALATRRPELAPYIDEGLSWVNSYLDKTERSSAYVLANGKLVFLLCLVYYSMDTILNQRQCSTQARKCTT